ncbi:MAG: zinc ribbon domain-containing protein [Deltaproteobacteria bacterium]|nr:zinc ribbon domain-containing protein [Deltaproteobacteria bacterium]
MYEYECPSCCNVFEVVQRVTEDPLTTCPDCSGPVKKLVSMSSFQLKGGGWYADGYSSKPSNGSGAAPEKKSTESSPAQSDKSTGSSADSSAKSKADSSATV